jgi:uncharacterized protein YeaO (DUF488 family)
VTKRHGRIYVVTRYYPRFLKKNLIDAYYGVLAPTKELLAEFKEREDAMDGDHDGAFEAVDYESKFTLPEEGLARLREIAAESEQTTVYFVCHCAIGQYCHREILMLLAHELFGAKIATLTHPYEKFRERLNEFR